MSRDNFSPKGCDARDLAVVWPCGTQIGSIPIPYMDSPTLAARQRETPDEGTL